jgi:hypothetical protein
MDLRLAATQPARLYVGENTWDTRTAKMLEYVQSLRPAL